MIVVFGSLNVDMVMKVGKLPHPGDTVLCPNYQKTAGGKGANQALAASQSGAVVNFFGKIGDDIFGDTVLEGLKKSSVNLEGVTKATQTPTGCATVCVDPQGKNMIIVASGANLRAREADVPDSLLTPETTLLIQMETPVEENWKLIHRAKKAGARILLNLAPAYKVPDEILQMLDFLIMNETEATTLALFLGFDVISPTAAARRISATFDITCIVTLGKDGAIAYSNQGIWSVKAMDIQAVDTTAAGDTFVGGLAASLDRGEGFPQALQWASVASGLTCLHTGAQSSIPHQAQIEANLQNVPLPRQGV